MKKLSTAYGIFTSMWFSKFLPMFELALHLEYLCSALLRCEIDLQQNLIMYWVKIAKYPLLY